MTNNNINAYCTICNKGYHVCNTCKNTRSFTPWRTVVDSMEHYKIYMAIHGYTVTKNKEQAKAELQTCDLSGLESFKDEIKSVINEIMTEPVKNKSFTKNKKLKTKVQFDNEENESNHESE